MEIALTSSHRWLLRMILLFLIKGGAVDLQVIDELVVFLPLPTLESPQYPHIIFLFDFLSDDYGSQEFLKRINWEKSYIRAYVLNRLELVLIGNTHDLDESS